VRPSLLPSLLASFHLFALLLLLLLLILQGNLAGYNLALNDGGVKGCPTYEQVRQPSMANFDVERYQGRWYENAFHDWTQFTEVYDTTLDIELNADKTKWLDDFGLKGPAPRGSPLR